MSDAAKTTLLDWWLRYLKLGWPVFPLGPRRKIPLISKEQGGRGCLDATLNEGTVRSWLEQCPNANIGIATGHRFFVLDVDVKKGGEESRDYLANQHGPLPDTIQQITGTGGTHYLFALPDFPVHNSENEIARGIDIRGKGGYIVGAPSIHPDTGARYFWDGADLIEEQKILPAPAWLLSWLRKRLEGRMDRPRGQSVPELIVEGGRNRTLFQIACSLRRKGFADAEILATLQVTNTQRCTPPLPAKDLETITQSSMRYAPDQKASLFAGTTSPGAGRDAVPEKPHPGSEEAALTAADVESAINAAIESKDMVAPVRLVPEIAKLRPQFRAVIIAKLRQAFGREFPLAAFNLALKDAAEDGRSPPPPDPPAGAGEPPGGGPDLRWYPLTDAGNGERIALLFGADVRYCVEMRRWLVWDGQRWAVDDMNVIRQKHKQMARMLFAQSAGMTLVEKHARASESFAAATAALGYAATEKGIPISAADLDQQSYLLNCPNGTVDLRHGTLLPHNREFLITKLCPVPYDSKAECPKFKSFIEWAMGGNPEAELSDHTTHLVGFLQRAFGYSLTSDVSEKAIFILHGERGNNGKTTLLTLFRHLLGKDYSGQISIDTVMTMKNQDATARADLADLRGTRLVMTSEVEKEHRLDEGKIKYITSGMGNIKSCRKYENPIEFEATHKLFMDCNHRPKVRGTDDAIWNRLKLIPFDVTISDEEKDLGLLGKLQAEMPGILAWAVRGCRAWLRDGLSDPPEVSTAGEEWREHDDPLKEFIEDCCEISEERYLRASELAAGYEWWAKQNREGRPLGREAFNERLQAKGFKQSRGRRGLNGKQYRAWEGIELRAEVTAALQKSVARPGWLADE